MNVTQIVNFLNNRRGYLKEGKRRLQQILGKQGFKVTLNDCAEALYIVRNQIKEEKAFRLETSFNQNYQPKESTEDVVTITEEQDHVHPQGMKIKSAWQAANGKMMYSYTSVSGKSNELEEFRFNLINDLSNINKVKGYKKGNIEQKDGYVLEISLPDLHFGKGNTEELIVNFFDSITNIVNKCTGLPISRILLPVGNDGMNSEGMRQSTTKGTPQQDTEPWFDSFRLYAKSLIEAVNYLKNIAPVDMVVVQGNHDYERMFYLGEVLSAYYKQDELVTVDNNISPRKFYHFGEVLIMYTHGDNEKTSELPIIMATERPIEFAMSKHRETHCGHFHKEMVIEEQRGIKTRFLPSICTIDEWHKKMGYESYRAAQGYLWHPNRGLEVMVQHNI